MTAPVERAAAGLSYLASEGSGALPIVLLLMVVSIGASFWPAHRATIDAEGCRRRAFRLLGHRLLGLDGHVNDLRVPSGRSDGGAECQIRRGLGTEHALKECRGFGEPARAGEARGFGHRARIKHVIHVESFLLLGNNRAS